MLTKSLFTFFIQRTNRVINTSVGFHSQQLYYRSRRGANISAGVEPGAGLDQSRNRSERMEICQRPSPSEPTCSGQLQDSPRNHISKWRPRSSPGVRQAAPHTHTGSGQTCTRWLERPDAAHHSLEGFHVCCDCATLAFILFESNIRIVSRTFLFSYNGN